MVPPLQNTSGTLPPDNAPSLPFISSLSPPLETNNQENNVPPTLSYAAVTSLSSRHSSNLRSNTNSSSRVKKDVTLFRASDINGPTDDTAHQLIHRTGTTDHSVFYQVPKNQTSLKNELQHELRQLFPFGVGLGLTSSEDNNGTTIEITLIDKKACDLAVATPISIKEVKFHASPAVHPDRALLRVNLTKLPIWSPQKLEESLMNNLSRYGIVREIVIYLDDCSGQWFTGNGHVYIERPSQHERKFETLTYKIPLEGENTFCLGTWSNMGRHCVYCKEKGHYRKECPKAPEEKRRCFQCGNTGHIARNCFRTKGDDSTSSKRRRETSSITNPTTTVNINTVPIPKEHLTIPVILDEVSVLVSEETVVDSDSASVSEIDLENLAAAVPTNSAVETFTDITDIGPSMILSRPRRTNAGTNHTLRDFMIPTSTKPCKCGATDHQKTNSSKCPLNKKRRDNNQDNSDTNVIDLDSVTNDTHTSEASSASNAMEED